MGMNPFKLSVLTIIVFLGSCATKRTTSPENWQKFVQAQKQYYTYSFLPITGFECEIKIPTLENTIRKNEELIANSGKYRAFTKYKSKLLYGRINNIVYLTLPSIRTEKASFWDRLSGSSGDENTQAINASSSMTELINHSLILELMRAMTLAPKESVYIAESEVSKEESRFLLMVKDAEMSIKNTPLLRTEKMSAKNGASIPSQTHYIKTKNGLLPLRKSSSFSNGVNMSNVETQFEFQNVQGWRLPQKITSNITALQAGTEVKSNTEIFFTNCIVHP